MEWIEVNFFFVILIFAYPKSSHNNQKLEKICKMAHLSFPRKTQKNIYVF